MPVKIARSIAALGLILALAAPGMASAAILKGASSKGQTVRLRTSAGDFVSGFSIRWRTGDCSRPGYKLRTTRSGSVPPLDRSEAGFFADRGQYRVRYADARVRYRVSSRGRMRGEHRWNGTFSAKAFVSFNDGSGMTCRLRRISWHVSD